MAYLHEQALIQARKKLYMLGSSSAKRPEKSSASEQEVGELASSVSGAVKAQKAGLKERQAAAAAQKLKEAKFDQDAREETEDVSKMSDGDYKQYLDDVSTISGNGPRTEQAMPSGINWGPADDLGRAKQRLTLNAAAAQAPIAGSFTRSGIESNKAEADKLTQDFHTSDQLMLQARAMDANQRQLEGGVRPMMGHGMMGTRPMTRGNY